MGLEGFVTKMLLHRVYAQELKLLAAYAEPTLSGH